MKYSCFDMRGGFLARIILITIFAVFSGTGVEAQRPDYKQQIIIDGEGSGRIFDGIGALSAGASSRLLYDYPEPERSQILDYLFKPGYGAALQILKVEIGGDSNSTSGAEPSHMRTPNDLSGDRGYEWWLMLEAKKRNPDIKLWGLEWCVPGWFEGGFWSQDNIEYQLAWLRLAEAKGLRIDYMGGWNERSFDEEYYADWHDALAEHFPHIKIVGSDDIREPWAVVDAMLKNPEFHDAIDIVGIHDPCHQRTEYRHCPTPAEVLTLDKKIWDSEQSSEGHDTGARALARAMNRQYIEGRMTANIVWSLISAWYANLPLADTGLMLADRPWSGYYRVGKSIWVHAHSTQFTEIGWRYLDNASGYLPEGASYVTLRDPGTDDYTIVVESIDAEKPVTVNIALINGLSREAPHLWETDLGSDDPADHFVDAGPLEADEREGVFRVTFEPDHVYTISTIAGKKGGGQPEAHPAEQMALPYHENFEEHRGVGGLAYYFSDLEGAFEIAPSGGGREGFAYRQMVTAKPHGWYETLLPPTTVIGDCRWWGDYQIEVDALMEEAGFVKLIGRIALQRKLAIAGYHVEFGNAGTWKLYKQDLKMDDVEIAAGEVDFPVGEWRRIGLRMTGPRLEVLFEGKVIGTAEDDSYTTGQVGLAVSQWHHGQFDNLSITKTGTWPEFVPQETITATAMTEHAGNHKGWTYTAANAVDGRPETSWSAEWKPMAETPQAITLDLGKTQKIHGLVCQPRIDYNDDVTGRFHGFRVLLSKDGKRYTTVAKDEMTARLGTKVISWPGRSARYVRIEALKGAEGTDTLPSMGEVHVALTPF